MSLLAEQMLICHNNILMRKSRKLHSRCVRYFLMTTGGLLAFSVYLSLTAGVTQSLRTESSFKRSTCPPNCDYSATRETTQAVLKSNSSPLNTANNKPLKIYIYNLNSKFNTDISDCVHARDNCFDYSNHGMGKLLYRHGEISVYNTNQFSLEVILHHQFAHSRYRTYNPLEADMFYVPAYMGSLTLCPKYMNQTSELTNQLFQYLNTMPYFGQGKPHLTSLAKIEREQISIVSAHPSWKNLTYMIIEKENPYYREHWGIESRQAVVVPYPSYIHLADIKTEYAYDEFILKHSRRVFLFLAASLRRSNPFRVRLLDQFEVKTELSFSEFFKTKPNSNTDNSKISPLSGGHVNNFHLNSENFHSENFNRNHDNSVHLNSYNVNSDLLHRNLANRENSKSDNLNSNHTNNDQIMLVTWECMGDHHNTTIEWMLNSVFCLQPHGDSPTRKSFYDSILSGCIPVVFEFPYEDVEFPFQRSLNYSNFVVQIPVNITGHMETDIPIYDYLRKIPQTEIKRLQTNLVKVLHSFQYPVINIDRRTHQNDAVDMIVDEIKAMYDL